MFSRSILAAAISLTLLAQAQAQAHAAGTATTEQIGNVNVVDVKQQATQNVSAMVLQDGDANAAYLTQAGSDLGVESALAIS